MRFTTERDCPFLCEWMKNWKEDRQSKYIIKHKYSTFSVYILYIQYIYTSWVYSTVHVPGWCLWFHRQISVKQLPLFTAYHMFIADTIQNVRYNTFTAILVYCCCFFILPGVNRTFGHLNVKSDWAVGVPGSAQVSCERAAYYYTYLLTVFNQL